MSKIITLNVKTRVDLRDVYLIERVTPQDVERLVAKTGLPREKMEAFHSNIRFIDGSNMLAIQDFDEIAAKAEGRFITVRSEQGEDGQAQASQIIPVDAIRHFEAVSAEDRQAMKARYADTDPAKIDALQTRIVYFGVDPESVETGRPNFFQKMFPVDIREDLSAAQNLDIVGIGHGRFVLASEITDARDLSEPELKSLARKYNLYSEKDGDLTTSITLRSGDLILSSLAAEDILGKPQGTPKPARRRNRRPVREAAIS